MKHKDTKPDDNYKYNFYWYITDESAREFATCDNCLMEVPLSDFPDYTGSKWLCEICANTTIKRDDRNIVQASNMILKMLGTFDNVEVLLAKEHIPDYYE